MDEREVKPLPEWLVNLILGFLVWAFAGIGVVLMTLHPLLIPVGLAFCAASVICSGILCS